VIAALEYWHEAHDAFVAKWGEDARDGAVGHADTLVCRRYGELEWRPGARWPVDDPAAIRLSQYGLLRSGAAAETIKRSLTTSDSSG
jgi:hypothetical protein